MFRHVSPSWGKCITLQHLTIPFPSVPCAAPKVSSNERGSSTKPSSHRGASSANAVTWRQKGFCMLLLSFSRVKCDDWWCFPFISGKIKRLMTFRHLVVFYCLKILSLSLTISNWISHLLHWRPLYGRASVTLPAVSTWWRHSSQSKDGCHSPMQLDAASPLCCNWAKSFSKGHRVANILCLRQHSKPTQKWLGLSFSPGLEPLSLRLCLHN